MTILSTENPVFVTYMIAAAIMILNGSHATAASRVQQNSVPSTHM